MGATITQSPMGIPEFGADPSNIVSYTLTSQPAGTTLVGTTTANISFNSSGVLLATPNGGIQLPAFTTAQKAALAGQGRVSVWIESAFLATAAANEYLMTFAGSTGYFAVRKALNQLYLEVQDSAAGSQLAIFSPIGKGSLVRFDVSWNGKFKDIFIDGLLCYRQPWFLDPTVKFDGSATIGGSVARGSGPQMARIYRYELSTKSITNYPIHPKLQDTIAIGHSFIINGGYPVSTAGSFMFGTGDATDSNLLATIHRELNKKGFTFGSGGSAGYSAFTATSGSAVLTAASINTSHLKSGMSAYSAHTQAAATIASIDSATQITLSSTMSVGAAAGEPFVFVDNDTQAVFSPKFDRICTFGCGGSAIASGANSASSQIDYAITMQHRAPTACILWTGVNDIFTLGQNPITSQFLTDLQAVITKLLALNASMKIVVFNMTNPAGGAGSYTVGNIDAGNAYIASLPSLYPTAAISVVDAFNLLGGWSNKQAGDFNADNIHLSTTGGNKAGVEGAAALYAMLQ